MADANQIKGLITNYGREQIANALAGNYTIAIGSMLFGDGNGSAYIPTATQTALVHQVASTTAIAKVEQEVWTFFEAVIPANVEMTVREIGITDSTGKLLVIVVTPDINKSIPVNGVSQKIPIRIGITTSDGQVLTVMPDPDNVPPFTQANLGLIKGRQVDGYVVANDDDSGFGQVYGWETVLRSKSEQPQGVDSSFIFDSNSKLSYVSTDGYFTYSIAEGAFYTSRPIQLNDTVYTDTILSDPYGVVSNISGSNVTLIKVIQSSYSLTSALNYYSYSINGMTLYSNEPLASQVILYTDSARTIEYGTVVSTNTNLHSVIISLKNNFIYNGTYNLQTYNLAQLQTSPELIVQIGNVNSHLQLATNNSTEDYGNHITVNTPNGEKTIPYIEEDLEPYVTNYIKSSDGDATFTSNSITLPTMKFIYPNGRDDSDNTLLSSSEIVEGRTYTNSNGANIDGDLRIHAMTDGEFSLFYVKSLGSTVPNFKSLVVSNTYTKWTDSPPSGAYVHGDIWYSNSNEMHITTYNSPNFTLSGGAVLSGNTLSNLGTLTGPLVDYNSRSLSQNLNLDFTTGSNITDIQDLFKLPYAFGTISNSTLKIFAYSIAYQVNYSQIKYSGDFALDNEHTSILYLYTINGVVYYTSGLATAGTILYTDANLSNIYGTVTSVSGSIITIETVTQTYSGTYSLVTQTYYTYNLGGTNYYTQPTVLANDTILYSNTELTTKFGVVRNLSISNSTLEVVQESIIIDNKLYSLTTSEPELYTYDINGNTYYTSAELAVGVDIYTDNLLSNKVGTVTEIDTDNTTVTVTNTEVLYTGSYTNITPTYFTYNLGGTNYYTTSELALNVAVYSDSTLNNYIGLVTNITDTNVTIKKSSINTYSYSYTQSSVYAYTLSGITVYSKIAIDVDVNVYTSSAFTAVYGSVESITKSGEGTSGTVVIHDTVPKIGYVAIQGTGYVQRNIKIYSDVELSTIVETSTGLNSLYTGTSNVTQVEIFNKSIEPSTQYTGTLILSGSSTTEATFVLTLNSSSQTTTWSEKTLVMNQNNSFILGGTSGFLGTFNLANTFFTAWVWNGSHDWDVGRVKCKAIELGTAIITNGVISKININSPIEVAKKADLGYLNQIVKDSLVTIKYW